jgi:1,4-dihydroxy-6-naphthoate synthase
MTLRLGFSPCPNDTFLFDALVNGRISQPDLDFEVVLDDVEALNQRALAGDLHLTKLSYAAFPRVAETYVMLRSGSALGRGVGPLLVSARPLEPSHYAELRVAIPGQYTTANFLLQWAFPEIRNKTALLFSEIEQAVLTGAFDAGLIIHESRFTYADKGLLRLADLGEIWEQRSGLPIPLGGIAARRDLGPARIAELERLLSRSVRYAFEHPLDSLAYVQQHAQEMDLAVQQAHIALYVNQFTEWLGEEGEQAVAAMLQSSGLKPESIFV